MSETESWTIKTLQSPDGTRAFDIVLRDDGVFQVIERVPDPIEDGGWVLAKVWGQFRTAEYAEVAALADFEVSETCRNK